MKTSSLKNWYLLSSKPHKDALAEEQLLNQGYEIYRPLAQRLRKRRGKMLKVTESLFPRYMFINLDTLDDNWAPIRSTYGVNQIIRFGNEPAQVPDELIQSLKANEEKLGEKAIDLDKFHKGEQVILTDGPFKGLNGIFLSYDGEERAMVLLEIMHSQTKLGISPAKLIAA
ncbi:MAG: transcription/translation regulatory transformer protein RfaH [Thiothrix nivea]|nr:MAG: transcription/translation regulatory transformer protein RfaH [Thiothrix nivea]